MTKKLSGWIVIALALLMTSYAGASSFSETCGSVAAPTGTNPVLTGAGPITCPAFTVPANDTLTSVEMLIENTFSQGVTGQTNTIQFTYSGTGFDAVTGLTTTSTSNPTSGSDGGATDTGNVTAQVPGSTCSEVASVDVACFEETPVGTSFSMTVSSSWIQGGTTSSGADGVTITAIFTYVPTATIPEPTSLVLIGSGLLGLGYLARRKRKV